MVAAVLLLPWGARTHFNTKGEPREAIVAVSMLQSGNYILPESYGHDIPYKPPMLAWCIAGVAKLTGGEVTEYGSRLPSAIAAIALVVMTFNWVSRRRDPVIAAMTSLVTLTAFEVMRNAAICRVDMLLTFFIVGSIYLLDTEGLSRGKQTWRVIGAILLMSCATLTKGPVGALLPCLVVGVYRLLIGKNFLKTLLKLSGIAICAMILPALWYYAAYLQGGKEFSDLALEENIGRLTGTMRYDSHLNPWWYNIICVLWGMAPYTLLVVLALIPMCRSKSKSRRSQPVGHDAVLAICGAILVIGFYCLPSSKRSVYLLPAYPFMAFGIVLLWERLTQIRSSVPAIYSFILSSLCVLVSIVIIALQCGAWQFVDGKAGIYAIALGCTPLAWWEWLIIIIAGLMPFVLSQLIPDLNNLAKSIFCLSAIYVMFFATLQPALLNPRSNKDAAEHVATISRDGEVYSFINDDYMRYFTLNYYLGDRMRMAEKERKLKPGSLLLMNPSRSEELKSIHPEVKLEDTEYEFVSCDSRRDTVHVFRIVP